MRQAPAGLASLLLCAGVPFANQPAQQSSSQEPVGAPPAATFRAETNLALVRFQVAAKSDFVSDLHADEIELREDGIPQKVLKQAGNNLSRDNIMKQAESLNAVPIPMLLPGVTISTSPTNNSPIRQMRLLKFNGKVWEIFGDLISG